MTLASTPVRRGQGVREEFRGARGGEREVEVFGVEVFVEGSCVGAVVKGFGFSVWRIWSVNLITTKRVARVFRGHCADSDDLESFSRTQIKC